MKVKHGRKNWTWMFLSICSHNVRSRGTPPENLNFPKDTNKYVENSNTIEIVVIKKSHNLTLKRRNKLLVSDDEADLKKSNVNLTTVWRKIMAKLILTTIILICPLVTEMLCKSTACVFSDKIETYSTKSYSLMLIRQRILVDFSFIFIVKLNRLAILWKAPSI